VVGKTLVPPLAQVPGLNLVSWINDRLPELLWAVLIRARLTRDGALTVFRRILRYINEKRPESFEGQITHTGLSRVNPDVLADLLRVMVAGAAERDALLPLLLLDGLPARNRWVTALGQPSAPTDWAPLMRAVALTLDHKSEEATDCRWMSLMAGWAIGKLLFPGKIVEGEGEFEVVSAMPELTDGLLRYPKAGDMGAHVRAAELMVDGLLQTKSEWAGAFWNECMSKTPCCALRLSGPAGAPVSGTNLERVREVRETIILHAHSTRVTTGLDARHDSVFGVALYCLDLLHELMLGANAGSILARMGLRSILECYVTLAYLVHEESPHTWESFRTYGAGQAKLAFLKLEDVDHAPRYVTIESLRLLANEDMWQDFLQVNLGHWNKTDLRMLSIKADVKEVYDRFYGWTSCFAHGHWGALRECAFDVCGNPLHRLHRVPRAEARSMPDVVPDACELVDKVLELVSRCYPVFEARITMEFRGRLT